MPNGFALPKAQRCHFLDRHGQILMIQANVSVTHSCMGGKLWRNINIYKLNIYKLEISDLHRSTFLCLCARSNEHRPRNYHLFEWKFVFQPASAGVYVHLYIYWVTILDPNLVLCVSGSFPRSHSLSRSDGPRYIFIYHYHNYLRSSQPFSYRYVLGSFPSYPLTSPRLRLAQVPGDPARICKVACGENFSAAMSEQGELWVWGRNDYGQLGLGEEAPLAPGRMQPVRIWNMCEWEEPWPRGQGVWFASHMISEWRNIREFASPSSERISQLRLMKCMMKLWYQWEHVQPPKKIRAHFYHNIVHELSHQDWPIDSSSHYELSNYERMMD